MFARRETPEFRKPATFQPLSPGTLRGMIRFALFNFYVTLATASPTAPVAAAELPPLRVGDIVFQTTEGGQSPAIMFASGSLYTHMGLVEIDNNGQPMVVEAVGPVRTIPLKKWIAKGVGNRITIKRIKGLSEEDARAAVARAHAYDGRPYDPYFYSSRDALYCSELVYAAYKEGPNVTVGTEQKVRDLKINHRAVRKLIEARWRKHPACQTRATSNFEACYKTILDQELVTPVSIARDDKLELVYSNFGPGAE